MENRFSKRIKLDQEILSQIGKIDQFKGYWKGGLVLSPQILGRLKSWVIITSTGSSTRIEGSKMSDQQIARFLRGLKSKLPENRDEEEVAGYANLLGRIFDSYETMKLTEGWILQFHEMLLHFSKKDIDHKGKYKKTNNAVAMINEKGEQVILFNPTPPHLVAIEMKEIIDWTNEQLSSKEMHPILVIANFIFEFLAIHPFSDGNGRVSRAITNFLLLKSGYAYVPYISLDEIIEQTKTEYYLSLRATQKKHKTKNEDITPWLKYFVSILLEQVKRAESLIKLENPEQLLSKKQSLIYGLFDDKELSVGDVYSLLDNKTPKVTIKQAISRLLKLKLVEKIGQGRATRYRKI
jgi:Fic family protein